MVRAKDLLVRLFFAQRTILPNAGGLPMLPQEIRPRSILILQRSEQKALTQRVQVISETDEARTAEHPAPEQMPEPRFGGGVSRRRYKMGSCGEIRRLAVQWVAADPKEPGSAIA